jgi:predicted transposase/invertase (TIGR01784 family)
MSRFLPKRQHDRSYRHLFSQPRIVEDLLRRFLPGPWAGELDFATLERLNASYVSERLQSRESDVVWRLRLRRAPVHLYLLLEFQSKPQRFMAVRQMAYTALFLQQLIKLGELAPGKMLPLVLMVVVYNGKIRWPAPQELAELIWAQLVGLEAFIPRLRYHLVDVHQVPPPLLQGRNLMALLIRLERSRTRSELRRAVRKLIAALQGPDDGSLRQAFLVWLQYVLLPGKGQEDIPELVDLEDFQAMLYETVRKWEAEKDNKRWRAGQKVGLKEGRKEGLQEGREKGRREFLLRMLEVKFGPVDDRTREKVLAATPQRLLKWGERLVTAERLDDVFAA